MFVTYQVTKRKQKMKLSIYLTVFLIILQAAGSAAYAQSKVLNIPSSQETAPSINDIENFVEKASPEADTGFRITGAQRADNFMMVTANPIATQAGHDILARGGSAADAAFAAQLVLGLVEPQSSGLGGGAFALYWDAKEQKLTSYDGRETAPASVTETIFLKNGRPMDFHDAATGGRAVGVPGLPKLLDLLYENHGTIPRDDVFQPAFELSKYGFIASPRLNKMIEKNKDHFRFFKSSKDYFLPNNGKAIEANQNIQNSDYNDVLFNFRNKSADIFYSGDVAQDIIKTVNEAWHNPGNMTTDDFLGYEVVMRDPVCGKYRIYKICSMGEPSSGGLTLIQSLQMLDRFDLETMSAKDPLAWHLIAEASRLAFADRNQYMADPGIVETPGAALIDPAYTAVRSTFIQADKMMENVQAGVPFAWDMNQTEPDQKNKNTGTTHISAIDKYGNAISLTSSIENAFGSKLMVDGFLLNNQLTDFSFMPERDGKKIANRAAPNKRPRSSMSPVIIFDAENKPVMVLGSAGGSRIIGYVLQRIIAVLDWDMPLDQALAMPNIIHRGGSLEIEEGKDLPFNIEALDAYGHDITRPEMNSGLTAIYKTGDTYYGAADPRREGIALGE